MTSFKMFDIPAQLQQSLERLSISVPTPIQVQAIPVALTGNDILASAQTGTGKTIAYLIPIITNLFNASHGSALILAPTRELADQIRSSLQLLLGKSVHSDIALLIGGAPIYKQLVSLRKYPRFIVGTPGRIIDHIERGSLSVNLLNETRFLVLDETDRMLDMGFSEDLEQIVRHLPKERQTLMFSATMPDNIIRISKKYLKDPQRIAIGTVTQPCAQIKQKAIQTTTSEKFSHLLRELDERAGSVIIFVKTKIGAANLADKLKRHSHHADAIHGDLKQRHRDEVIRDFRNEKNRIMVATDIAARGLDIPHIMHVINYDLPQCADDYIHRIGRTGRAGLEGHALSFVSPEDNRKWRAIDKMINPGRSKESPTSERRQSSKRHKRSSNASTSPAATGEGFGARKRRFANKNRASAGGSTQRMHERPHKFAGNDSTKGKTKS